MAMAELFEKKPKKKPGKFADEGPPSGSSTSRGGADPTDGEEQEDVEEQPGEVEESEGGEEPGPHADGDAGPASAGGFDEHMQAAADDLADIMHVAPEDRGDFMSALKTFVHAAIADVAGGGAEPEPADDEGMPGEQ
jgi:hypothetical protein